MTPEQARRLWRYLEPVHSMIYFAPEAEREFAALGLRDPQMCYLAARSAPMGAVGPGVVAATFYNFNPAMVAEHIPGAWSIAAPGAVLEARLRAADEALRRLLGQDVVASAEIAEAAALVRRVAERADVAGRALFAGHADLPWPEAPHLALWHGASLLREFRGDGHITALVGAELSGLEALITHVATGKGFVPEFAKQHRGWSDAQWDAGVAALAERGIVTADGTLTAVGESLRTEIEISTDRLALGPWAALDEAGAERLGAIGKELTKAIMAGGAFPTEIFASR